jgi:hypothetical protein
MGMSFLSSVVEGAIGDLQERSRKRLYESDPQAWLSDVLGKRWYSKQEEIVASFMESPRTAVKSANGCGKSAVVADLITWQVAVSDPRETLCIVSAPTLSQIEKVIFAYLKINKSSAGARGMDLPGRITETLAWKLDGDEGSEFLVFGKRPSDRDIVSSFQGTRKLRTMVFLDEAGGLPADMFTAAEAVATGSDSRILAIGNPDRRGTEFHKIFTDSHLSQDWNLHTISAFDLPTFTGEVVYPDVKQQDNLLAGLTSVDWVEHKKRAWGVDSARYKAKVLGEFPDEADNTFYGQEVIDRAYECDIVEDDAIRPVLGVDVARFGSDENRMYINQGGRVRRYEDGTEDGGAWSKTDLITTARKVHAAAQRVGAKLVNVDVNGVGGGVVDALVTLDEFRDAVYDVGAIAGSNASPDNQRWFNARAWHYDTLREKMAAGQIDLDYNDSDLREQLITQTYKFSAKGAVQITSKDEMKKNGLSSPDALDAAILCVIDFNESDRPEVGSVIEYDYDDVDNAFYRESFW